MGLDVSYYSKLRPAPDAPVNEYGQVDYDIYLSLDEDDLARRAQDLPPGIYSFATRAGFRGGSYGGYNAWRNELAVFAGFGRSRNVWDNPDAFEGMPFFELINFSDCEGTIGPKVSAKLASDFADHQGQADTHPDEYWRGKYSEWRRAFEVAADGGCVDFH